MTASDRTLAAWCELRHYDIVELRDGETKALRRRAPKERLLITLGTVQLVLPDATVILKENQFFDLPDVDAWRLRGCAPQAQAVQLSGDWGRDVGGCGIFRVARQDQPTNIGDPVAYPKATSVDNHYHDCDEYWIVLEGSGSVRIGARDIAVGPGDCVAIGMGHHHDFPLVDAPVKAVFFETTLQGERRVGHLWTHTHGAPAPVAERV
ncbi:MAG: cupin domain-containing protein [Alphaproteobacteria bacterium]